MGCFYHCGGEPGRGGLHQLVTGGIFGGALRFEPRADLKGGFPSGFGLFGQPCGGLLLVNSKVRGERGSAATAGGAKLTSFGHEGGEKGLFGFLHKMIYSFILWLVLI